jgi:streptogramin lyase
VADSGNHRIRKIDSEGFVSTVAGSTSGFNNAQGSAAQFNSPYNLVVNPNGDIYVADSGNRRIRRINSTGFVTTFAGSGIEGSDDSLATIARFLFPEGIEFDSIGSYFVADSNGMTNSKIRRISSGMVSAFAGNGLGFLDGQGTSALFFNPKGLVADLNRNLYVADYTNNRIRKISPSGLVSTIAGNGSALSLDGQGTNSSLFNPVGVALDSRGNLYVTEQSSNKIRVVVRVTSL